MSQKLPVNNFEGIENTFKRNCNEENDEIYFLRADVKHLEKLHELHNSFITFMTLPEKMEIEKVEKLVTNLRDKTEYVIHITNLNEALNHELFL